MSYEVVIAGIVDDGFTSAVINDQSGKQVARVFELSSGWFVETDALERLQDPVLMQAVLAGRNELLHYVNRKGGVFPEGSTRAGISLWLMERDDGEGFSA